jgi:thiamine-phosphate pyrophosphorylase
MKTTTQRISGLYAVTPEWGDTGRLLQAVGLCLEGGVRWVQYRNKGGDVAQQHEQASELLALCRRFGARLIVNDNLRLADLIDADGVHLGKDDASVREARIILGPKKIIGVSCYNSLQQALEAEAAGADYVAFGSFFVSGTKPAAVAAPLPLLQEAKRQLTIPVVAIGGITPDNAGQLIEAGADALAVIAALFDSPDIKATAQQFASLFYPSQSELG